MMEVVSWGIGFQSSLALGRQKLQPFPSNISVDVVFPITIENCPPLSGIDPVL